MDIPVNAAKPGRRRYLTLVMIFITVVICYVDRDRTLRRSVSVFIITGRDPQLQVVTNKAIELKGHKMQQLDSIISAKGQTAYSSVILGNVGNQLLTMQITLPADDQQKAQTTAENIINTLVIQ